MSVTSSPAPPPNAQPEALRSTTTRSTTAKPKAASKTAAKTPTGKLQKTPLREAGVTPATWDRESVGYTIKR